jgi:uncharacterized cofD-like protein
MAALIGHETSGLRRAPNSEIVRMTTRVAVLGGGHGLAAVLRALRDAPVVLTAIVTTADDGGSSGDLRRQFGGPAVGDLRRSLIALSDDSDLLASVMSEWIDTRYGRHSVGNLLIRSLTDSFGDLESTSRWLGQWLGISGSVLPASIEPVTLLADTEHQVIVGESAIGRTAERVLRLRFRPQWPHTPPGAVRAILSADWVLIAPGSLYTSTLATCALPQIRLAIARAPGRVLWVSSLEPERAETASMTAEDQLAALRTHGVRVDDVLYDPGAKLRFSPTTLARSGVAAFAWPLQADGGATHDSSLLCTALESVLGAQPSAVASALQLGA